MSTVMGVVWYNAGMQPTIHPFSVPLIVTRVVGVLESIPPVIRLSAGDPSAFLPILSFTLNTFSPHFAEELVGAGLEVTGKTDLRFTDTLYKVLRDIFHYKPIVSKQQFLQKGFVQRKISTLCDIIHLVLQRDSELKKVGLHQKQGSLCVGYCHGSSVTLKKHIPKVRIPVSHKDTTAEHHSKLTKPDSFSNIERRLSVMEVQIKSLLCSLKRLSALEDHLVKLTSRTNTENEEELITISRENWENLNVRILLLENKLEMAHTKTAR
ncbi:centrosomal protein of 44 kDa isoform X2 [Syngnathoides biaculeatus]|uniref:centrosomal protein of 44 kDa isoform X2 n=1 Tax=Syngnathoides biaculeatus TaxID=300417 RepID=UPI002ADDAC5F|nr:centrosomal protein of 44 kDa isoform X2 [Syngnathoides biaculeatus]